MDQIWNILQIEVTKDKREIKRAYARRSKEIHPEEFQKLYEAYQRALRYASYGEGVEEKAYLPETEQKEEKVPVSEEQNDYEKFGFYSEAMQEEKRRLEEIRYFQSYWDKQIFEWKRGGGFLSEAWKAYLQSERFEKIMWFSLVMETIAAGMMKHFQGKKEVLQFFWELYGLGILEKLEEESSEENESLQLLYKSLYPVGKEIIQKQNIEFFTENWRVWMDVWENGSKFFSEEWKEYLRSEKFREIMWHSTILETITAGMMQDFRYREEMALFFWDLYGFEKLGEENCVGKSLLLYKTLRPAYLNRVTKQRIEIQKEAHKQKKKAIMKVLYVVFGIIIAIAVVGPIFEMGFSYECLSRVLFNAAFYVFILLVIKLLIYIKYG